MAVGANHIYTIGHLENCEQMYRDDFERLDCKVCLIQLDKGQYEIRVYVRSEDSQEVLKVLEDEFSGRNAGFLVTQLDPKLSYIECRLGGKNSVQVLDDFRENIFRFLMATFS